jgi:hypothetical protein
MFKAEGGVEALHFLDDFVLQIGKPDTQTLRSREAVVWLSEMAAEGRSYRHLQVFLWKDAEVTEFGGTVTLSPALFVTVSTFGQVITHADQVVDRPANESQAYREGERIRKAIAQGGWFGAEGPALFGMFDPTGVGPTGSRKTTPKPVIQFQTNGQLSVNETVDGGKVITVTGGVYLSRGTAKSGEYLETLADNAVVFLSPGQELQLPRADGTAGLGAEDAALVPGAGSTAPKPRPAAGSADRQLLSSGFGDVEVEGVYLEGDVQFTQGPHMIRASRLYYDFLRDRALILDAVVRTLLVDRNVPLYIRAAEIRQLSTTQFTASNALITTSEFHTPHYHVGARRIDLDNTTPPDLRGKTAGMTSGVFRIEDATLNLSGHPVLWWPFIKGNVDTSETAIRSIRTGYSDDFGFEVETKWHLYNLLGLETPKGFDATLGLDYFSERGPAMGVNARYERDTYLGLMRSYLLADSGEDSLGRDREEPSTSDIRGRFLMRHRHYLEDDWQLSLEFSYLSDRTFLEEFFEPEFDNDKEQETLLYLKKQQDNWAFTALLQTRLMDFLTQTERYPDLAYFKIGEPLGDRVTWYSENRLGVVRYRTADQTLWDILRDGPNKSSGATGRADTRQEFDAPFDLGSWRFVPFVTGRGSAWTDSPHDGGMERAYGSLGVRGTTYLSRIYPEYRSEILDADGVRHIIKPEIAAWTAGSNLDPHDLYPFDQTVEGMHDAGGASLGVRQRWQTKRGEGENRRNVDVFTHDLEMAVFDNATGDDITNGFASYSRPENSIARNHVNSSTIWRVNDRTAILSEMNYDLNDSEVDILNISMAVERTPRLSYLIGYRFIDQSESNLLGFDLNYRLTEKHSLAFRESFDLDRGETLDFTVALIRKHPRWFSAVSFNLDESEDDFGVSLSIWPEGLPQAALGSRRFTGLAQTTRLQND